MELGIFFLDPGFEWCVQAKSNHYVHQTRQVVGVLAHMVSHDPRELCYTHKFSMHVYFGSLVVLCWLVWQCLFVFLGNLLGFLDFVEGDVRERGNL